MVIRDSWSSVVVYGAWSSVIMVGRGRRDHWSFDGRRDHVVVVGLIMVRRGRLIMVAVIVRGRPWFVRDSMVVHGPPVIMVYGRRRVAPLRTVQQGQAGLSRIHTSHGGHRRPAFPADFGQPGAEPLAVIQIPHLGRSSARPLNGAASALAIWGEATGGDEFSRLFAQIAP